MDDEKRVVTPQKKEKDFDSSLRPEKLKYYVGQEKVKKKLNILC